MRLGELAHKARTSTSYPTQPLTHTVPKLPNPLQWLNPGKLGYSGDLPDPAGGIFPDEFILSNYTMYSCT